MHDFGRFPGLVLREDGIPIIGEVYEVEDALLPVLDEIEQIFPDDDSLFVGAPIEIDVGGKTLSCVFYPVSMSKTMDVPQIPCGDWVDHRRSRCSN